MLFIGKCFVMGTFSILLKAISQKHSNFMIEYIEKEIVYERLTAATTENESHIFDAVPVLEQLLPRTIIIVVIIVTTRLWSVEWLIVHQSNRRK